VLVSEGRDPLADGVFGKFGNAVKVEFFHDVASLDIYGLAGDSEGKGDLLGALAVGHQLEHSLLDEEKGTGYFTFPTSVD
jgi:hypothetical protein